MRLRSLLFVPGDRPERFAKAAASGADAIILDLEDSVSLANKDTARHAVAEYLAGTREVVTLVRVNPLDGHMTAADVAAIIGARPDAIMLPKAEGAASIAQLDLILRSEGAADASLPAILPIATETPSAIFTLGSYREAKDRLLGLTWGAEDLPAAIGAATSRNPDGSYTSPYEVARSLTLFAAHGAGVAAIDTVFPTIKDEAGLAAYAARAPRRLHGYDGDPPFAGRADQHRLYARRRRGRAGAGDRGRLCRQPRRRGVAGRRQDGRCAASEAGAAFAVAGGLSPFFPFV